MSSIVVKEINGYGPYKYRVTNTADGQEWEYLGRADGKGAFEVRGSSSGSNSDSSGDSGSEEVEEFVVAVEELEVDVNGGELGKFLSLDNVHIEEFDADAGPFLVDSKEVSGTILFDEYPESQSADSEKLQEQEFSLSVDDNGDVQVKIGGGSTSPLVTKDYDSEVPSWDEVLDSANSTVRKGDVSGDITATKESGGRIYLESPYEAKEDIESVDGASWNGSNWSVPVKSRDELEQLSEEGWEVDIEVEEEHYSL